MYLVIECCDREISDIRPAKDQAESVKLANRMLEDYLNDIGYDRNEPDSDGIQRCDPENGEDGAWCNLRNAAFDAFRVALGPGSTNIALSILLTELCKKRSSAPGSECRCDGACDGCPVQNVIKIVTDMSKA